MRKITDSEKAYLLSLKPEDLTFDTFVSLFGNTIDTTTNRGIENAKRSKFETTDTLTLLPGEYFVKEPTNTTVGRFIYNKYIVERLNLQHVLGYVNDAITDSYNNKVIESKLSKALIDDKISIDTFYDYLDCRDTLGQQGNSVITTSFTQKTLTSLPEVQKRKAELFKQYDKELNSGDIVTSEKIEKELTAMAKNILKGDPGMDLYNSEARGNFGNYKNMQIYKGATLNNKGEYEIVRSSFMDGISKQDIPSFGTAVVAGAYPKAVTLKVSKFTKFITSGYKLECFSRLKTH